MDARHNTRLDEVMAATPKKMEKPVAVVAEEGIEALKDISFGSLAGVVGKIVEYPFDTVKVRLQSQPDHVPLRYTGPLDCFKQSLRQDGVRGLYRGISAPLVGAAAETACLFYSYRVAQNVLRTTVLPKDIGENLPLGWLVLAGAMSGCVTSLVLTPIELIKCRMQVPSERAMAAGGGRRHGPLAVIKDVWRHEGLKGFWRGQLGTLLRETGGSAAWFGSYEMLSLFFKTRLQARNEAEGRAGTDLPVWQRLGSGAVAGMGYNFILYPADTIKSKIQTEQSGSKTTFTTVAKELWRSHGLRGLYRGCGITVARSAPSSALIFTVNEELRKLFS